jgi:inosine/xanthosine triphosphatase
MIRIVIGSTSAHKRDAVLSALKELGFSVGEVATVDAPSGIPPQPYGKAQTLEGAGNRARAARETDKGAFAVGIENGLVPLGNFVCDIAYVVIYTPSGRRIERRSDPMPVPQELVDAALAAGQQKTAGSLEAERSGCDPADPHVLWSGGTTTRKEILAKAVTSALQSATNFEEGDRS